MGGVYTGHFQCSFIGQDLELTSEPPIQRCTQHSNAIKTFSLLLQKAQRVHCSYCRRIPGVASVLF
jgi:hypothetical protein